LASRIIPSFEISLSSPENIFIAMNAGEDSPGKPGGSSESALNSLRNFRLQKKKLSGGSGFTDSEASSQELERKNSASQISIMSVSPSHSESNNVSEPDSSPIKPAGCKRVLDTDSPSVDNETYDSPTSAPVHKRIRMLSESGSENGGTPGKSQGIPTPEEIDRKVSFLASACPNMDVMALQDTLRAHEWNVEWALESITKKLKQTSSVKTYSKKQENGYINKKMKAHHVNEDNSESDDDEFTGKGIVYDSDEDDEALSDENLTGAKKKVLKFFNEGGDQELTGIQGCNKKKVQEIVKLRPFEGWVDLVTKFQTTKQLNTDMLNSASDLLRMKSGVTSLMNKCQRITNKIEGIVEKLTSCSASMLELKEQPKSLNQNFTLSVYQLIGLNWLMLMHRQSINGILADEMGLGKTIQTIAFLAHLKEMGDGGPHLIVVPSSTLENWRKELELWAPDIEVIVYWGSQDERRSLRTELVQDEIEYDVILTTYNMVISSPEDRVLFKKMEFHYAVFDEAHMLKNMACQRYEQLMKISCSRKLLLTGTPLQNNLVELMSLLTFVMPNMFSKRKDQLKKMFSLFPKSQEDDQRSHYEQDRIAHAKRIMKPFFLRRLKKDVLTDLPKKTDRLIRVPMVERQNRLYYELVSSYKDRAKEMAESGEVADSGIGMLMNLRKTANHPLLVRDLYTDSKLQEMARLLKTRDSGHKDALETFIIEDLQSMSDYQIHRTCEFYRCIEGYKLSNETLCESGKFKQLDELLPKMQENGDRVLIFSQFTMLMDIMERYLKTRGHKYLRLDGQTPVQERQFFIDKFNKQQEIFIFILSTRAGGLGINLTAANTVIMHDLDFNPYNDKQAEDRCHRVGQTREVRVIKFTSENTIEDGIYAVAQEKLQLEQDVTSDKDDSKGKKKDISKLLKAALGVELREDLIGDLAKVEKDL